jgi:cyclase
LDIRATIESRKPPFDIIEQIAGECFMPLAYGGGINNIEDIRTLFSLGVEKVILNTSAVLNQKLVSSAADLYGNQSIVVALDVHCNLFGKYEVFTHGGQKPSGLEPFAFIKKMVNLGAGELFINSINRDGTMKGYDLALLKKITSQVNVPVIACGGAGKLIHFKEVVEEGGVAAVAAGSLFVFKGKHRAVLINYPDRDELEQLFFK